MYMCTYHSQGFYCCNKTSYPKPLGDDRAYFIFQLSLHHTQSSRKVRTATEAGQVPLGRNWSRRHGEMLLTGIMYLRAHSVCFNSEFRTTFPELAQWTGPSHISCQSKTCPTDLPQDAIPQMRFPLPEWQ